MTQGTAAKNTYIFEVSSGTRLGGGAAEHVLYFIVGYTTTDGAKRSIVLSPSEDAISNGFAQASAVGSRSDRRATVEATFGYQTTALDKRVALSSVQTDQMMFTTPAQVQSIDKVQIFGRKADGFSDWACQGMRFYRVDTIYGLEMYGWYSSAGYIDFSGEVIAEAALGGEGNFRWNNSAGMFTIVSYGASGGLGGVPLVTTATKESYEASHAATHVGLKHESQFASRVMFRIDFADTAFAGFESLAGSYGLGSRTKISTLKFCECAALTVRYTDIYDCIREITLPLVINAVGQAAEVLGDAEIIGYAQQGDSIALSAMLPDYKSINSTSVTIGEEKACAVSGISTTDAAQRNTEHRARAAKTADDSISYTCFAVYQDVAVSIALDGATVRYRFEAGPNNPIRYSTATSSSGVTLYADRETMITMQAYRDTMVLAPADRQERYLITISTDNVSNAGTESDVILRFRYTTLSGEEAESIEYNAREYVRQFYGEWPGNVDDFAYRYGFRDGGSVQFIIPIKNVKTFTNVSVKVNGDDDWQFSGLNIAMVKNYEGRTASWAEINSNALQSHVRYDRRVDTQPVCFSIGRTYEPDAERNDNAEGDNSGGLGTLIQNDASFHEFDGRSREVSTKEDVNWAELRHFMTYNDALKDLGFTKERCLYKVEVHVAGDKVNADDDDCGSKNLFYFRLIFENGVSGCTLANQQIMGDAFRTGAVTPIKISTSQDYGDLTAIQIIPDSQDGNGDIYDKLKIDKIVVTQETTGPMSPTWIAGSSSEDGLGWIGISYRDPGEYTSNKGAQGRSLSELATTYEITETSLSVKLLIGITTGAYGQKPGRDDKGNLVSVPQNAFSGGVALGYRYIDSNGVIHSIEPSIDAVEAMNNYAARPGVKKRTVDGVTEDVSYTVSDPAYQFREGKTDYFFVTIQDIAQLLDLSLEIRSSVVTDWSISAINAWMIRGEGTRYINSRGEYDYRYEEGETPELVASWDRDENLIKPLQVYRTLQNNGIALISNIPFKENHIELDKDAGTWSSAVRREPQLRNDSLNLYLYPATGEKAANPNDYNLKADVRYTDAGTTETMQISAGTLNKGVDPNGRTVFYATGLSVTNMDGLLGVDVTTDVTRAILAPISYGVLQRVREGVLIDTYRLGELPNADPSGSMGISNVEQKTGVQRVLLQVSEATGRQQLSAESNDLAVALHFRTNDISGNEYRSKYVYLTDQGYTSVSGGQVLELDYALGDVSELTGVSLAATGALDITLSSIYLANQDAEGSFIQSWGVHPSAEGIVPSAIRADYSARDNVEVLTLRLKTAENAKGALSSTQGPVRMTLGYYDEYGVLRTQVYENIRPYIVDGNGFAAGETDVVQMLIPGISEIRWVELEPWHDTGEAQASWKLEQLSAELGLGGSPITKTPDQTIVEGTPLGIGLATILVAGDLQTLDTNGDAVAPAGDQTETEESGRRAIYNGENSTVLLKSGEGVKLNVRISGSTEGFTAKLESYDANSGAVGAVSFDPTHKYSTQRLDEILASAQSVLSSGDSSADERTAAQNIVNIVEDLKKPSGSYNVTESGLVFRAPRNYTGGSLHYRITITAKESAEGSIVVDLTVKNEEDLLFDAITRLEAAQTNALMKEQIEKQRELERRLNSMENAGGRSD
ncbi:MAG: hypothetical protein IJV64_02995 [Oscillospiraceae bacterium]|nr:hypothetical protein [Oscillospiraceae bacterium]